VDATDAEAINEAIESVVKIGGPIRHLFCFAGIVGCHHALEMTEAQWKKILDVNTTGSFLCAQAIGKHIVARKSSTSDAVTAEGEFTGNLIPSGGTITLIGSVSAHAVNFPQAQAAYNVSKSAVLALKSSLAAEWAVHGIRVNSISPGYMDTTLNAGEGNIVEARKVWMSRNPMGRMGAVGELDGMCVLLASRAGSYINGADMVIDGGMSVF
jgi:NAD(P)-dependent dehydrogenase (short-subunit alcohol dehydrogenase family)